MRAVLSFHAVDTLQGGCCAAGNLRLSCRPSDWKLPSFSRQRCNVRKCQPWTDRSALGLLPLMSVARGAAEEALGPICMLSKRDVAAKQINGGRTSSFYIEKEWKMKLFRLYLSGILACAALVLVYSGAAHAQFINLDSLYACDKALKTYNERKCNCFGNLLQEGNFCRVDQGADCQFGLVCGRKIGRTDQQTTKNCLRPDQVWGTPEFKKGANVARCQIEKPSSNTGLTGPIDYSKLSRCSGWEPRELYNQLCALSDKR